MTTVSKSQFKSHAQELLQQVERSGETLVITDHGTPVLTLAPYRATPTASLRLLRGTVVKFDAPTTPVGGGDWESDG